MRTGLSAVIALITLVGLGCQSSTPPASQATTASMTSGQRAVIVSGGNAGNVTVFLPSDDPASPTMLSASGATVCPECKAAAAKYFQTGVLDPKCSRTGATRAVVTAVPPTYGHN
jgi:hypothetical protein